jgi:hypothetical protein
VEWAKSRARALRWGEEVTLLVEEMRRVLWFLRWKREWWMKQSNLRQNVREEVREGLVAYSFKQAAIFDQMMKHFGKEWYTFLRRNGLDTEWPEECMDVEIDGEKEGMEGEAVMDDDMLEIEDDMFD